ncbi:MAG TPA: NERD domain-containing protein [Gammaproteobacteria bacterium]|jgi:hypothetical protein|nr:NERD domain-containing protein [Gammaproteobacteria bacterium]
MLHGAVLNNWLVWGIVGLCAALLAALIGLTIWWRMTAFERHTRSKLVNIADRVLRDAAIPDGMGGWVVIDAIMLRDRHIHVLDFRDVEGAIFGAEKMDHWTIIGRRWRSQFQNPMRLMQDRVLAVRALLPELEVSGHVLFSTRAQFPKGRPEGVQLLEEFVQPLTRTKSKQAIALDAQAQSLWQRLCDAAEIVSRKQQSRIDQQSVSTEL